MDKTYLTAFRSPQQQVADDYAQRYGQLLPFIERVLGGEKVEGITPLMAQQLMQYMTPTVVSGLADRGYQVDPNWYQNYIQPGRVNPETYAQIMNYAYSFGGSNVPENIKTQALSVFDQPVYQAAGYLPTHQQQMLQDQITRMRMGLQNKVFDPYRGTWVDDPNIGFEALRTATGSYDAAMYAPLMELINFANEMYGKGKVPFGDTVGTTSTAGTGGTTGTTWASSTPLPFANRELGESAGLGAGLANIAMGGEYTTPQEVVNPTSLAAGASDTSGLGYRYVPNMWTIEKAVNIANQLGWDYNEVMQAKNMVDDLVEQGADMQYLAQEFERLTGIPLDLFLSFDLTWKDRVINTLRERTPLFPAKKVKE